MPRIHLVNPSTQSFGVAVITPRWLYVLAAASGTDWGDPTIVDETLEPLDIETIGAGDVVGIGIHTGNALRGYEIGREVRKRGAWVVFGGIHATLFPEEVATHGMAHTVVRGDGDLIWARVVEDCLKGEPLPVYEGGRIEGDQFASARWDLLPERRYMWASVQTVRGCPKHCSFCSVWRTDGQEPRQRAVDRVVREIVELRRLGFRFIALADDNFYPVTFDDVAQARRRADSTRLHHLDALREERFELMARLAELPDDLVFYTQITMEAAEDPEFLAAMKRAKIRGALVGVESVTRDGLKDVYKGFNLAGEELVARLRAFRNRSGRGSRSYSSRSCIARCTRTPGSRPTAPACSGLSAGRAGSVMRAGGCFTENRCRISRFPATRWQRHSTESIQVLHEDHFVALLVVNDVVDDGPRHHQAEPAGTQ